MQYIISTSVHKIESHKYVVTKSMAKIGKICIYVISKYTNYRKNYHVITFKYPAKLRTQIEAWIKKIEKPQVIEKLPISINCLDDRPAFRQVDIDIDINAINWAKRSKVTFSSLNSVDNNLSEVAQNSW